MHPVTTACYIFMHTHSNMLSSYQSTVTDRPGTGITCHDMIAAEGPQRYWWVFRSSTRCLHEGRRHIRNTNKENALHLWLSGLALLPHSQEWTPHDLSSDEASASETHLFGFIRLHAPTFFNPFPRHQFTGTQFTHRYSTLLHVVKDYITGLFSISRACTIRRRWCCKMLPRRRSLFIIASRHFF